MVAGDLAFSDSTFKCAIFLANSVWKVCGKKPEPDKDLSVIGEDAPEVGFAALRAAAASKSLAQRVTTVLVLVSMIPEN